MILETVVILYQTIYFMIATLLTNQSGAAEAWWAHNPQVPGSKPGSDTVFFFFLFLLSSFSLSFIFVLSHIYWGSMLVGNCFHPICLVGPPFIFFLDQGQGVHPGNAFCLLL
jgi:hypothetical protein